MSLQRDLHTCVVSFSVQSRDESKKPGETMVINLCLPHFRPSIYCNKVLCYKPSVYCKILHLKPSIYCNKVLYIFRIDTIPIKACICIFILIPFVMIRFPSQILTQAVREAASGCCKGGGAKEVCSTLNY